jgi:putative transposase
VRVAKLSIRRQCELLGIARSGIYRPAAAANDNDHLLMRRIDSRRMTAMLRAEGYLINRKRVQRLMRKIGIAALGPRPHTSKAAPEHKIFPYLLRGLAIERPNQVWCADITYIRTGRSFLYLEAIMDWASRAVLAWRLSNTIDTSLCVSALQEALALRPPGDLQHRSGQPVHQCSLHRRAAASRRAHLDGQTQALDGQRGYRAAVALA